MHKYTDEIKVCLTLRQWRRILRALEESANRHRDQRGKIDTIKQEIATACKRANFRQAMYELSSDDFPY